jgi:hypothetical protein
LLLLLNHRLLRTLPLGSLGAKHPLRSHVDKTSSDAGVGDQASLRQTPPRSASVFHYIHDWSVDTVRPRQRKGLLSVPDSGQFAKKNKALAAIH